MKKVFCVVGILMCCVLALSLGLLFGLNNNAQNDTDTEQPQLEEVDFSTLTYTAIGDSITYGSDGQSKLVMDNPYPQLVGQTLGLKAVSNVAIGGMFLTNNNPYMNDCISLNCAKMPSADIISVAGGVNDFLNGVALGSITDTGNYTIYGALNTIATCLKEQFPNAFCFFITPFKCFAEDWCSGNNGRGYSLLDVSIAMKNVAMRHGFAVFDCYNLIDFSAENDPNCLDGLHPTQSFVENYTAPQIAQFIKDNYKG